MVRNLILVLLIFILTGFSSLYSQGFDPPSEGKVIIYFNRCNAVGALHPFAFFHQEKYIGTIRKQNYLRYECNPGEQLFWSAGHQQAQPFFITAELEEGGIYIVNLKGTSSVKNVLTCLVISDNQEFKKAKMKICKKKPEMDYKVNFYPTSPTDGMPDQRDYDKIFWSKSTSLSVFIQRKLDWYEKVKNTPKWQKKFNHITIDMAIPSGMMKCQN